MEQASRAGFNASRAQSRHHELDPRDGSSLHSIRRTNSRQNQLPTVNENLGRAPPFVSNQGNFESAGSTGRGFEAPQAQLGNFGVERGEPGFESSLAHQRSPQGAYRQFESPDAHLGAQGSQGGLQGFDTSQVHRMAPRPPNFRDDTPQTNNHSRDHHHRWAKPSSGPPSRSLSSSQSGCSIVMGTCHQCAATGLLGEQCTTRGTFFIRKRGCAPCRRRCQISTAPAPAIPHLPSSLGWTPGPLGKGGVALRATFHKECSSRPSPTWSPQPPRLPSLPSTGRRLSQLCCFEHGGRRRWRFFGLSRGAKSSPHWSPIG